MRNIWPWVHDLRHRRLALGNGNNGTHQATWGQQGASTKPAAIPLSTRVRNWLERHCRHYFLYWTLINRGRIPSWNCGRWEQSFDTVDFQWGRTGIYSASTCSIHHRGQKNYSRKQDYLQLLQQRSKVQIIQVSAEGIHWQPYQCRQPTGSWLRYWHTWNINTGTGATNYCLHPAEPRIHQSVHPLCAELASLQKDLQREHSAELDEDSGFAVWIFELWGMEADLIYQVCFCR